MKSNKEQLVVEYRELKVKIEKLKSFMAKLEKGYVSSKTPYNVFDWQLVAMTTYLEALKARAEINNIDLETSDE